MQVADVMSRKPITIEPSESCLEAVGRMHRAKVRHLPVTDRTGRLLGIITDRDLRHHMFSPAVFPTLGMTSIDTLLRAAAVADLMVTEVVTVESDETLAEAARIMLEKKVGSLPVLEGGQLVGILTETDLLQLIVRAGACASESFEIVVAYP